MRATEDNYKSRMHDLDRKFDQMMEVQLATAQMMLELLKYLTSEERRAQG